jgi:hypothetical protein
MLQKFSLGQKNMGVKDPTDFRMTKRDGVAILLWQVVYL